MTADYNVGSIFSIGRAAPHRFFEPGVRKPLTFEVPIQCFVKGARAGGDTIEGSENLIYNTRGVGVWRAWRGRDEESANEYVGIFALLSSGHGPLLGYNWLAKAVSIVSTRWQDHSYAPVIRS